MGYLINFGTALIKKAYRVFPRVQRIGGRRRLHAKARNREGNSPDRHLFRAFVNLDAPRVRVTTSRKCASKQNRGHSGHSTGIVEGLSTNLANRLQKCQLWMCPKCPNSPCPEAAKETTLPRNFFAAPRLRVTLFFEFPRRRRVLGGQIVRGVTSIIIRRWLAKYPRQGSNLRPKL